MKSPDKIVMPYFFVASRAEDELQSQGLPNELFKYL